MENKLSKSKLPTSSQKLSREVAIRFDNVFFRYHNEQKDILEDISFVLHKGESMTIIGPNGGGKSTCLMLLIGKLKAQRGSIEVFGKPYPQKHPLISGVFQKKFEHFPPFPISLAEFISLWGLDLPRSLCKTRTEEALKRMNLIPHAQTPLHTLSTGQIQRALIACALVNDSPILFFDEPTSNLDEDSEERFYMLLKELRHAGKTLILVSHDISVAPQFSDKTLCINKTLHELPSQKVTPKTWKNLYAKDLLVTGHSHIKKSL